MQYVFLILFIFIACAFLSYSPVAFIGDKWEYIFPFLFAALGSKGLTDFEKIIP